MNNFPSCFRLLSFQTFSNSFLPSPSMEGLFSTSIVALSAALSVAFVFILAPASSVASGATSKLSFYFSACALDVPFLSTVGTPCDPFYCLQCRTCRLQMKERRFSHKSALGAPSSSVQSPSCFGLTAASRAHRKHHVLHTFFLCGSPAQNDASDRLLRALRLMPSRALPPVAKSLKILLHNLQTPPHHRQHCLTSLIAEALP